jgi:hypothetical protein
VSTAEQRHLVIENVMGKHSYLSSEIDAVLLSKDLPMFDANKYAVVTLGSPGH